MQKETEYRFLIKPEGPMPDFRTVAAFLWSDFHDFDSDGNSYNPASREWTQLRLTNRSGDKEEVMVLEENLAERVLSVSSSVREVALGVAYFIIHWSGGSIYSSTDQKEISLKEVMNDLCHSFDLLDKMESGENSIWNSSTLEEPYPNLKN